MNKQKEMNSILSSLGILIVGLDEFPQVGDIEETGTTLLENAYIKARTVYELTGLPSLADDTGLEIESLNNRPGVYSAMYAGADCNAENNMRKVLSELKTFQNRKAQFKTVIALIINDKKFYFEGKVEGTILKEKNGISGFGYDPIFIPNGYDETFAQMSIDLKNKISHRGIAVRKLVAFLNQETLGL